MSTEPPIPVTLLRRLHDMFQGTEADIAFGHLRHIIREYEKLRAQATPDSLVKKLEAEKVAETSLQNIRHNKTLDKAIIIVHEFYGEVADKRDLIARPPANSSEIPDIDTIADAVKFGLINAEPFTTEDVIRVTLAKLNDELPIKRKPEPVSVSLEGILRALNETWESSHSVWKHNQRTKLANYFDAAGVKYVN
ncbi:hypothetical protein [Fimbriiglobus ruber]|uniref:hypothetical protein n=1 Tax=Fimbriiglobus ruber TaxID=1908690 RepID=UPI000B4BCB74|nr:hypothetical protein [Fimbriiglobus ruber]